MLVVKIPELYKQRLYPTAVVDSVSRYEDAKDDVSGYDDEDTPSYSTPRASEDIGENSVHEESPLSVLPSSSSTPAIKMRSPANVHFSFSEVKTVHN